MEVEALVFDGPLAGILLVVGLAVLMRKNQMTPRAAIRMIMVEM